MPDISAVAYGNNNYTTNATTWPAIDAVNLTLTITLAEPRMVVVLLSGSCAFTQTGFAAGGFDLQVDGVRVGDAANGLWTMAAPGIGDFPVTMMYAKQLAAGAHTFVPVWAITFGTGRLYFEGADGGGFGPGKPTLFVLALNP